MPESTRLWEATIEVEFIADNPEDAAAIVRQLTERVFDHPCVWAVQEEFDPKQPAETVDA